MGLRQTLNQKQGLAIGVGTVLVLAALGFGVWHLFPGNSGGGGGVDAQAFFTIDEGKTFFTDKASNTPPYTHEGKQAVGCTVFSTDNGKTTRVGWLLRYTNEGKQRLERLRASKGAEMGISVMDCIEVKKPGDPEDGWVRVTQPKALEIQRPPKISGVEAQQLQPE